MTQSIHTASAATFLFAFDPPIAWQGNCNRIKLLWLEYDSERTQPEQYTAKNKTQCEYASVLAWARQIVVLQISPSPRRRHVMCHDHRVTLSWTMRSSASLQSCAASTITTTNAAKSLLSRPEAPIPASSAATYEKTQRSITHITFFVRSSSSSRLANGRRYLLYLHFF